MHSGMLLGLVTCLAVSPRGEGKGEVQVVRDVAYVAGKDADPVRHRLDLYLPRGKRGFPVLLFAHGGWKNGRKEQFEFLGKALAGHGVGVVSVNYRLYPQVKFPANAEDVARAFAWTHRHIGKYGGRPDCLFVGGHSAGGHLVSLLATDAAYLKAHGLSPADIRGAVSISGLYAIPRGRFPLFEDTEEAARKASPARLVKGKPPPFLLVYADKDFPRFGQMAEDFAKVLRDARGEVRCMEVKGRTHGSVAARIAEAGDPVRMAILRFISEHCRTRRDP